MTAGSPSTPAAPSTSRKLQVRRKLRALTAQQILERRPVELPDGTVVHPLKGEWLVSSGSQVIDVVHDLDDKYAIIEEGLLIPREVCTKLEKTTGVGTTQTLEKFSAAVDRLARIAIGSIRIEFTPGQVEEIKQRATKRGYTVKQELERIVDRIKDEIFYGSANSR